MFFEKKEEKVVYLIGETKRLTQQEKDMLAVNLEVRTVLAKWIDVELMKVTSSMNDMRLTNDELRQKQGFANGLIHTRNFIRNIDK